MSAPAGSICCKVERNIGLPFGLRKPLYGGLVLSSRACIVSHSLSLIQTILLSIHHNHMEYRFRLLSASRCHGETESSQRTADRWFLCLGEEH